MFALLACCSLSKDDEINYFGEVKEQITLQSDKLSYNLHECRFIGFQQSAISFTDSSSTSIKHLNIYASIFSQCSDDQGAAIYNCDGCTVVCNIRFMCASECKADDSGSILFFYSKQGDEDHAINYLSATSCNAYKEQINFVSKNNYYEQKTILENSNISNCNTEKRYLVYLVDFQKLLQFNTFHDNHCSDDFFTLWTYIIGFVDKSKGKKGSIEYSNFLENSFHDTLIYTENTDLDVINCIFQKNSPIIFEAKDNTITLFDSIIDVADFSDGDTDHILIDNVTIISNYPTHGFTYYETYNCHAHISYPRITRTFDATTPVTTPFVTPHETPFVTPMKTPISTPVDTLYATPLETLSNTPCDTPFITPLNTPCDTPLNTFVTSSFTDNQQEESDRPTISESVSETISIHESSSEIQDDNNNNNENNNEGGNNDSMNNGNPISKGKGSNSTLYIVIGVTCGVIVIIGAIILFLVFRKKKQNEVSATSQYSNELEEEAYPFTSENYDGQTITIISSDVYDASDPFSADFTEGGDNDDYFLS